MLLLRLYDPSEVVNAALRRACMRITPQTQPQSRIPEDCTRRTTTSSTALYCSNTEIPTEQDRRTASSPLKLFKPTGLNQCLRIQSTHSKMFS